jgi:membrane associated rhomboid family serine protease
MSQGTVPLRVALLPEGLIPLLELVLIFGSVAYIVARRDVPKAYALSLLVLVVLFLDFFAGALAGGGVGGLGRRFAAGGLAGGAHPLGFRAEDVLSGATWWAPFTSIFVHADFEHALGNLLLLAVAGPALEDRVGSRKFLVIFFTAAFAALAAQTALAYLTTITTPDATAVGASGGIFGILTAFATRYPRERLPFFLIFIVWIPAFVVLLIYLGMNLFFAFAGEGRIAWWGHFAGFLVGLAFTRGLPAPKGADAAVKGRPGSAKGLPDPKALEVLATTAETRRVLDRLRQFTPETRTADDTQYVDAWLDQFFEKARCPACGGALRRSGTSASCERGDYRVDFGRKA